jgi:glutamate formiminotransferase
LPVTGSEIVGLVPLRAMLEAADYYIDKVWICFVPISCQKFSGYFYSLITDNI